LRHRRRHRFHLRLGKGFELHVQPRRQELRAEAYFGAVNKYGLDIGTTKQTVMQWIVLSPIKNIYAPVRWPETISAPAPT